MGRAVSHRRSVAVVFVVCFLLTGFSMLFAQGCGEGAESSDVGPALTSVDRSADTGRRDLRDPDMRNHNSGAAEVADTPQGQTSEDASAGGSPAVADAFEQLAKDLAPLPVYAPSYLPAGSIIPDLWWPVLELSAPEEYVGAEQANPMVERAEGAAVSGQVVVQVESGWLLFFQNFRGDLGDVAGEPVGEVAGRAATQFLVGDAVVIQWSDEGKWYGVAGRGLPASEVRKVALSMSLVIGAVQSQK